MKKIIYTLLFGLVFLFVGNVAKACEFDPVHYLVKAEVSKIVSVEISAEITAPTPSLNHLFVLPDRPGVTENRMCYVDNYILKLPKHYLLPEKSEQILS